MSITKEHIALLLYIKNMLADLIYINGVIATELIKVTENTAVIRHGEGFLNESICPSEHKELNERIIKIVKKYKNDSNDTICLEKHILSHLKNSEK